MVSNVLAAAAILRQHYRRMWSIGLLGSLTALGLVPLALYMPRVAWARYVLLLLACLYAGRKSVQYFRARGALKQLSMEEHFLRYGSSDRQVQKCIESDENLWTKSCTLAAIKTMAPRRLPEELLSQEKRDRIMAIYRRTFRRLIPQNAVLDLWCLGGIAFVIVIAPTITVDMRAVMFQAGFLSLALAVAAEASHLFVNRRLGEALRRLFDTLIDWTLSREFVGLATKSPAYSHHLHYFAPPWFASGGVSDEFDAIIFSGSADKSLAEKALASEMAAAIYSGDGAGPVVDA